MAEKKSLKNADSNWVWGKDHYESYKGGGTPAGEDDAFHKGVKVNPSGKGRGGWTKAGKPGKREDEQPRDKDGHFTYNSMIGKPLKDISKKDGHSRGTTIPPMFNDGVNGAHVITRGKGGKDSFDVEGWEGIWFEKGTEVAVKGLGSKGQDVIKIAPENIWVIAQEWVINEFGEEVEIKEVEGNPSHIYRTEKSENGSEQTRDLGKRTTKHKILVYKGTDTPVIFSDLKKEKGEFGSGKMKEQLAGKAKETGDISQWKSKPGRHSTEGKEALAASSAFDSLRPVTAKEEEAKDLMGGKINERYLADEKAAEEAKEQEEENRRVEKEKEAQLRKERRDSKKITGEIPSDVAKKEEYASEKFESKESDISTYFDAVGDDANDIAGAFDIMDDNTKQKVFKTLKTSSENIVSDIDSGKVTKQNILDAYKKVFMEKYFNL